MGAVQAQDYPAAKWALAQRTRQLGEAVVDQALAAGTILRTHLLRPTWHFVTPADIRWMLALSAQRIIALSTYRDRQLGLDPATFRRSNAALVKALQGGRQLTRAELMSVLRKAGIKGVATRFGHLIMRAELNGVVCSGALRGKQHTYALFEERVPPSRTLARDEALVRLAERYFTSRGPATLHDFIWWSGLTGSDARIGLEAVKPRLESEVMDGKAYWFAGSASFATRHSSVVHLLPNFDEYLVGYRDRGAVFDIAHARMLGRDSVLFSHTIVANGQIRGTWKRRLEKKKIVLEVRPFTALSKTEHRAVAAAAERYSAFLELPVALAIQASRERRPTPSGRRLG